MKRDYIEFQERSTPLTYLITIRAYGTWLHGDERGSMDRREYNQYGEPKIAASELRVTRDRNLMKGAPCVFDSAIRQNIESAIREVCEARGYRLYAINVRTNHAHTIASASTKPELMMNSFKSYATRKLRSKDLIGEQTKVWARHGSTRYLWTEQHIDTAVEYVVNGQGGELPTFD
ncbi:MAG: transposase [Pyrinomonadaceae bacterium]